MAIVAASMVGPQEPFWDIVKRDAERWAPKHVVVNDLEGKAWGNEAYWRKLLWSQALEVAEDTDWIFVLDADFILAGDPRVLTDAGTVDAWAFDLYDLWERKQVVCGGAPDFPGDTHSTTMYYTNEYYYREDGFWHAHWNPRPWMFRAAAFRGRQWSAYRGIHVGHAPVTKGDSIGIAPHSLAILHLGWLTPELRQRKFERYKSIWHLLGDFERAHVETVLDENPNLRQLPNNLDFYLNGLNGLLV